MAKLTVPSIQKLKLKGWPLVLAVGLLLALIAIVDRGGLGDPDAASASTGCELQVTASPLLNVRSAPNAQATLVRTLESGDRVAGTSVLTDGFRRLGDGDWVDARYVTPTAGSTCS